MRKKVIKVIDPIKEEVQMIADEIKQGPVKIVTVQTVNPRKIYLCGQAMEFLKGEIRILRSDKIKYLDEILKKLAAADPPVIKIIEVKEE